MIFFSNLNPIDNLIPFSRIELCAFNNFSALSKGGVLFLSDAGNILLMNNLFTNNSGYYGGAIYFQNALSNICF